LDPACLDATRANAQLAPCPTLVHDRSEGLEIRLEGALAALCLQLPLAGVLVPDVVAVL
jgi:hypothetical protein